MEFCTIAQSPGDRGTEPKGLGLSILRRKVTSQGFALISLWDMGVRSQFLTGLRPTTNDENLGIGPVWESMGCGFSGEKRPLRVREVRVVRLAVAVADPPPETAWPIDNR